MTRKALVWLCMSCMAVLALGCGGGGESASSDETGVETGAETGGGTSGVETGGGTSGAETAGGGTSGAETAGGADGGGYDPENPLEYQEDTLEYYEDRCMGVFYCILFLDCDEDPECLQGCKDSHPASAVDKFNAVYDCVESVCGPAEAQETSDCETSTISPDGVCWSVWLDCVSDGNGNPPP